MTTDPSSSREPAPEGRSPQYSLKTLLLAVTFVAILCSLCKWAIDVAIFVVFAAGCIGGATLARRMGGRNIVAVAIGGALGAGIGTAIGGPAWDVSFYGSEVWPYRSLRHAATDLAFFRILHSAILGGIFGIVCCVLAADVDKESSEDDQ